MSIVKRPLILAVGLVCALTAVLAGAQQPDSQQSSVLRMLDSDWDTEQPLRHIIPPEAIGAGMIDMPVPQPIPCEPELPPKSITSGYDNGFFITSPDGDFKLKIRGLLQTRFYTNWRDIDSDVGDDIESGFAIERASLILSGNMLVPELSYWLVFNGDRNTGTRFVEEATVGYELSNGMLIQIGRLRNPAFLRELDVSYARQLGIERSYYNSVFTTGVLEGITLTQQNDYLRWIGFLSDGRHSGSGTGAKDFYLDNTDFAFTFGTDWKLFGEWAQYGDLTSWSDEEAALFIGVSAHYEHGETGDDDPINNAASFFAWTTDLTYEWAGLSLFGSFVGRQSEAPGSDVNQTGALFMAGYHVIPDKAEPYCRCEYIDFDGVTDVGSRGVPVRDSSVNILALGFNWYFNRQASKLTFEIMHAFDEIPFTAGNTGLLADQANRDGQTVFGSQLQLFF